MELYVEIDRSHRTLLLTSDYSTYCHLQVAGGYSLTRVFVQANSCVKLCLCSCASTPFELKIHASHPASLSYTHARGISRIHISHFSDKAKTYSWFTSSRPILELEGPWGILPINRECRSLGLDLLKALF